MADKYKMPTCDILCDLRLKGTNKAADDTGITVNIFKNNVSESCERVKVIYIVR
jgi:hypothetical protein